MDGIIAIIIGSGGCTPVNDVPPQFQQVHLGHLGRVTEGWTKGGKERRTKERSSSCRIERISGKSFTCDA